MQHMHVHDRVKIYREPIKDGQKINLCEIWKASE